MSKLSGIELKRARLVPSAVFASPDEVLRTVGLSRVQKIAILRRWEFDARPTAAHAARQDGLILDQIRRALIALGAAPPVVAPASVTRHGSQTSAEQAPAPARPWFVEPLCAVR